MGASSSNDASNNSASPQAAPKPVRDNPPQPVYSVAKDSTPLQNVFRKFVYGIDDAKLNPPSAMSPSLPSPSAPEAKSSMPPNLPSLSPSPPEAKSSMPPNLPSASEVKSPMSSRNDSKSPPSKAAHLGFQVPFQALFRSDPSSTELKLLGPNTKLFDHNSYEWKPNESWVTILGIMKRFSDDILKLLRSDHILDLDHEEALGLYTANLELLVDQIKGFQPQAIPKGLEQRLEVMADAFRQDVVSLAKEAQTKKSLLNEINRRLPSARIKDMKFKLDVMLGKSIVANLWFSRSDDKNDDEPKSCIQIAELLQDHFARQRTEPVAPGERNVSEKLLRDRVSSNATLTVNAIASMLHHCFRLVKKSGDGDIKQHVVKKVHTLTDFQLFMNRFSPDGLGLPRTLMTLFRAPVDGDYVTQTIPSVYLHMDRYEAKDLVDNFKESSIVRFSERNPECFVWYSKQRGSELIRKFSNGFGIRNPSISGMPGDRFFGDIPTLIESYNTESINNDMKTECAKWIAQMPARVNSNKRKSPDAAEDEDVVIVNHPAADDDRSAQDNDDVSILNRPADAAAGPVPKKQRRKGGLLEKMFFQYCDIREFH